MKTERRIFLIAALTYVLASPGQTYGISVFVEPMLAELEISRTDFSRLYALATLAGAATAPFVGRQLDRRGLQVVGSVAAALFAIGLAGCSQIHGLVGLFLGLGALRVLGQGALGLTANQTIAVWFRARRGAAAGLCLALASAGMAAWPWGVERALEVVGWRAGWVMLGMLILGVLLPVLLLGLTNPSDMNPRRSRRAASGDHGPAQADGWTLAEARRTEAWWLLVASGMTGAALVTGLALHQVSILAEKGLDSGQAAAAFAPHFIASGAAILISGPLLDRLDPQRIIAAGMGLMAAAMVILQLVPGMWGAWGWATCLGLAVGALRVTSVVAIPRWFGLAHLGELQGAFHRLFVASSALGAIPLARHYDVVGRYDEALWVCAAVPAITCAAAFLVRPPERPVDSSVPLA